MELALLGICILASLMAGVKPYTKEKFAFAGITLLLAGLVFGGGGDSAEKIKQDLERGRTGAAGASAAFGMQVMAGSGKVPPQPGAAATDEVNERVKRMTTPEYAAGPGTKSMYRRVVRILPLGRIKVRAPETPGITVLTGYTSPGPSLGSIPTRVPLGVLDPKTDQRPSLNDR